MSYTKGLSALFCVATHRRLLTLTGVVAAGLAVGVPMTFGQGGSIPAEADPPGTHLTVAGDQQAAGAGDAAAAERILKAGGWSVSPGTVRSVAGHSADQEGRDAYTLWGYDGVDGPAHFLVGASEALGGVQTDCSGGPVLLKECGNAVSSDGHALLVGGSISGTKSVRVRHSHRSTLEASAGDGAWVALLPFSRSGPYPDRIISYGANGGVLGDIDASLIRSSMQYVPAGAAD